MEYKGYVALSELPQDKLIEPNDPISFRQLALPQGFREDQVAVNVDKIEKILQIAGLSMLVVQGYAGKKTEQSFGVNSIHADGTGTGISSSFGKKEPLNSSKLIDIDHSLPPDFRKPIGLVTFNTAERDERIKQKADKYPRRQLDPVAHSDFMDTTIKYGLSKAAGARPKKYNNIIGKGYPIFYAANQMLHMFVTHSLSSTLAIGPSILLAFDVLGAKLYTHFDKDYNITDAHISAMFGYDRMIAAKGLIRASRLVKPVK